MMTEKPGTGMFIAGVILAGIGLVTWKYAASQIFTLWGVPVSNDWEAYALLKYIGQGMLVIGGGLGLGGLVRMLSSRE